MRMTSKHSSFSQGILEVWFLCADERFWKTVCWKIKTSKVLNSPTYVDLWNTLQKRTVNHLHIYDRRHCTLKIQNDSTWSWPVQVYKWKLLGTHRWIRFTHIWYLIVRPEVSIEDGEVLNSENLVVTHVVIDLLDFWVRITENQTQTDTFQCQRLIWCYFSPALVWPYILLHDSHDFIEVDSISEAQVLPLCIMGDGVYLHVALSFITNHVLKKVHLRKSNHI